jgi:hypothetical protein
LTLRQKQSLFATACAKLILRANEMGYAVTLGEAWRPPETAALYAKHGKGIANSLHTQRLAVDLNLFADGKYLSDGTAYRPLGEWWEAQSFDGVECCWGGRFSDGNHFSFAHQGRK